MRALILAVALAIAPALAVGCMSRPPQKDRSGEVSYNRRELPPEQGLFTGSDGEWTVYRNNRERKDCGTNGDAAGDCPEPDPIDDQP